MTILAPKGLLQQIFGTVGRYRPFAQPDGLSRRFLGADDYQLPLYAADRARGTGAHGSLLAGSGAQPGYVSLARFLPGYSAHFTAVDRCWWAARRAVRGARFWGGDYVAVQYLHANHLQSLSEL